MSSAASVPSSGPPHPRTARCGALEVRAVLINATQVELRLHGEMDLANADLLPGLVAHHLRCGHRFIRLALGELRFLDCAGLRAIVDAHNQCLTARGSLVLTGVRPQIARMLAITHLDEALAVTGETGTQPPRTHGIHLTGVPTR